MSEQKLREALEKIVVEARRCNVMRVINIATEALAQQPAAVVELTDDVIYAGWKKTFSTENPFCPCDLKSFTKSVKWAERTINIAKQGGAA